MDMVGMEVGQFSVSKADNVTLPEGSVFRYRYASTSPAGCFAQRVAVLKVAYVGEVRMPGWTIVACGKTTFGGTIICVCLIFSETFGLENVHEAGVVRV